MSIVISEETLSDIFFNSEHPNWAHKFSEAEGDIAFGEYADIIRPDAQEFCNMIGNQVDVEWLVKDFCNRV